MPLSKELAKELVLKYGRWLRTAVKETSPEEMRKLLSKSYKISEEEFDEIIHKGLLEVVGKGERDIALESTLKALRARKPLTRMKLQVPGKFRKEIGEAVKPQLTLEELKITAAPKVELPKELAEAIRKRLSIPGVRAYMAPEKISRVWDKTERLVKNFPKEEAKSLIESDPTRYFALPAPRGVEGVKYTTKPALEKAKVLYERAVPVEKKAWAPLRKELKAAGIEPEAFKEEWNALWKSETEKSWWKEAMKHQLGGKAEEANPRGFFFKMLKMAEENPDAMARHPVNKRFLNRINVLKKALPVAGLAGLYAGKPEEAEALPKATLQRLLEELQRTAVRSWRGGAKVSKEELQRTVDLIKKGTQPGWKQSNFWKEFEAIKDPGEALNFYIGGMSKIKGEKADLTYSIPNVWGQRPRIPRGKELNIAPLAVGAGAAALAEPKEAEAVNPREYLTALKKAYPTASRKKLAEMGRAVRRSPKGAMERIKSIEALAPEEQKALGPRVRGQLEWPGLKTVQSKMYLNPEFPEVSVPLHESGHELFRQMHPDDRRAVGKIFDKIGKIKLSTMESLVATKMSNEEELFAEAFARMSTKSKWQVIFSKELRDIIKKYAPKLGVVSAAGVSALYPKGEAEASPLAGPEYTPLREAIKQYTGATPIGPQITAETRLPGYKGPSDIPPISHIGETELRAAPSKGAMGFLSELVPAPLRPSQWRLAMGGEPAAQERLRSEAMDIPLILFPSGAGMAKLAGMPGAFVAGTKIPWGKVIGKVRGLYGGATEEVWQAARKLWYAIPYMEKAWKTSLTKMEETGMQKAAGLFRQRLRRMGVQDAEIVNLSKGIYKGLSVKEEAFASEVMRSEPVALWKNLAEAKTKYGVGLGRAKEIVQDYVTPVRKMFKEKGYEATVRGLLKDQTYLQNIETYLPRMYWTKEVRRALQVGGLRPLPRQVRLDLQRFMKRTDIPEHVRAKMQEINQLSYISYKGLRQIVHDNETMRLFQKLTQNPDWVRRATRAERLAGVFPAEWTMMPKGAKLGPLSGKMVKTPIAEEINEILRVTSPAVRAYSRYFLTPWKFGKTVLRLSTHARNIISNFILNDLGGLSPVRLDIYAKALWQTVRGRGKEFNLAGKYGVLDANFVAKELSLFEKFVPHRKVEAGALDSVWQGITKYPKLSMNVAAKLYQGEEQWFKLAKFTHNLNKGLPYAEAARDAVKWTFNYGEITPFIRGVKTYAMPFATFTYKALPIVAETAIKHPLRLAKYPLAAIVGTGVALDQMGFNEKDWERLKKTLPLYMKRGHFLLLPYKDNQNRLQFADLTYIYPWGDIGEMAQQGIARFTQNPILQLTADLSHNKSFAGNQIWYEWEGPKEKAFKVLQYVWRQMMPSYVPGAVDWESIQTALEGQTKEKEALNLGQSLLKAFAGVKIKPIAPVERAGKAAGVQRIYKSEATREFRRQLRRHPEKARELREKYRRDIKRIYNPPESILGKVVGSPVALARP